MLAKQVLSRPSPTSDVEKQHHIQADLDADEQHHERAELHAAP
jgi:hypothetical protein